MTLSQFAEHRVTCSRTATAQASSSERPVGIRRKGNEGSVDSMKDSSTSASDSNEPAVKRNVSKEASPGQYTDDGNDSARDRTPCVREKYPLFLCAGVVRLASHRQACHVENMEGDGNTSTAAAPVSRQSSGGKASDTNGGSSTSCEAQPMGESKVSQERKSPVRPTTVGLGIRRAKTLTATALKATLANYIRISRPNDRTPATVDMLTSPSGALNSVACVTLDASIAQEVETAESGLHLAADTSRVASRSLERWTVGRLQTLSELETEGADSERGDRSVQLNPESAERNTRASGNTAAVGSSQNARVHDAGVAARKDGTGRSSGQTISEEAVDAFGGGATSYARPSREGSVPLPILDEMYRLRKATFTFSDLVGVSTLESEKKLVMLSEREVLYGYTFRAACLFRGLGGLTLLAFGLFFCSGEYDDFCPWPFAMKIMLEVMHPRKDARNMRVQLHPSRAVVASAFRKLEPRSVNPNFVSRDYAWSIVVKAGFVAEGALRVDVRFE